jgi:hypothetical protein
MKRHQFESAVSRATGESLRTILCRGFTLMKLNSGTHGRQDGIEKSRRPRNQSPQINLIDQQVFDERGL